MSELELANALLFKVVRRGRLVTLMCEDFFFCKRVVSNRIRAEIIETCAKVKA
jgi:hypothetical protein